MHGLPRKALMLNFGVDMNCIPEKEIVISYGRNKIVENDLRIKTHRYWFKRPLGETQILNIANTFVMHNLGTPGLCALVDAARVDQYSYRCEWK